MVALGDKLDSFQRGIASKILFEACLGDNTYIENCIIESLDTIRANSRNVEEDETKAITDKRYGLGQPYQKGA